MSGTIVLTPEQQTTLSIASNLRAAGFAEAAAYLEEPILGRIHLARHLDKAPSDVPPHDWSLWQEWVNERRKGWKV